MALIILMFAFVFSSVSSSASRIPFEDVTSSNIIPLDGRTGVYTGVNVIGGGGGIRHNVYGGGNGKLLQEIVVWAGEWQIKAIRITLTGDSPVTLGNPSGPSSTFTFQAGETISKLSLWGNGAGTRLGAIKFESNKGNHFDFGMTKWPRKQEYNIDVGSGICVGMILNSGDDVDNAGFVFLNPIASSKLINVQYPSFSFNMAGVAPQQLEHFGGTNRQPNEVRWSFSKSVSVSTSSTWSTTVGVESFVTMSVTAKIPEVAEMKAEAGWKMSAEQTHSVADTETKTLSWNESGVLASGQSISLTAVTKKGDITTPYEGTMQVRMVSGEVFEYPYKGEYKGVSYSDVDVINS